MTSKKIKNITGRRFGRLTVKSFIEIRSHAARWLCVCDCGNKKIVRGGNLTSGATKSCGCLCKESLAMAARLRRGIKLAKFTGNKMQCSNCGEFKLFKEFKEGRNQCNACLKEIRREYNCRPEVKKRKSSFLKKYRKTVKGKTASRQYKQQPEIKKRNKKRLKIMNKKRISELTDSYVKNKIMSVFKNIGLKPQDITPEMIEIKRDLLLFHRESKKLRSRLS